MKRRSLTWRVFQYNLFVILCLIVLTGVAFNLALRAYVERDTIEQLSRIADRTEAGAQRFGPGPGFPPPLPRSDDPFWYYLGLDRALREPLNVVNADYILLDPNKQIISVLPAELSLPNTAENRRIVDKLLETADFTNESHVRLHVDDTEYLALVHPVTGLVGVGWIVIYSSLERLNELRLAVTLILATILLCAAAISALVASLLSKRIAAPFATLSRHIRSIADRNFGQKIDVPVDMELAEFVDSVNTMSKRLQSYDQAQKTFLQNVSHEFRTPIMAIQSYAEGIKHGVVDEKKAADVIVEEAQRLTHMVEDLLYLSRLDALEEPYRFEVVPLADVVRHTLERAEALASQAGKAIDVPAGLSGSGGDELDGIGEVVIYADSNKLARALLNVLTNCIRYADSRVEVRVQQDEPGWISVTISDDGPGIAPDDLPHIFERFYKGRRGVVGLGLAITKHIVERHGGTITAENKDKGALFTIRLPLQTE